MSEWIHIDDALPDLGVTVFVHSREKGWIPSGAHRKALPGNGWRWDDDNASDFGGLEYWMPVPPLPPEEAAVP